MTKTDGTLWGFGLNEAGGLGLNDKTNRSSPTQIGTGTDWGSSHITTTGASAMIVKSDNTLWAWGSAWGGGLGLNSWTQYSSPIQVGTDSTWTETAVGGTRLAAKTDGTLWSWGYVGNGMSGLNVNNSRYSSPTQIGTDTTWSRKMSVGATEVGCMKTDGSLWMWGANSYGNLAQNNNTARSSPTQVTGTTWSDIAIGRYYTLSTKTDGTLWTWGFNHAMGTLGNNTSFVDRSSPIQVPGSWAEPNVSREASWALKQV